ncbi:MAG: arylsulfotransferase family protein [Planctomycetota bacterium]
MRWPYFVLLALLIAAASSLVGPCRPFERQLEAPLAPADGRGWVTGIEGLYGVAREAARGSAPGPKAPDIGAIGYAQGSEAPRAARGDTGSATARFDVARTQPGVNLMTSGDRARAELRALDDTLLHAWEVPYSAHDGLPPLEGPHQLAWRRVALLDDGGLLAIHDGRALLRIDADSRPVWALGIRAHHDLALDLGAAAGPRVHVLTRAERVVPAVNPKTPVIDDRVATLDLDGNVLREFSLWDAFTKSAWGPMLQDLTVREGDVMHSNSIELLDGQLAERHPAFAAGNWLICMRDLDLIVVVDPEAERVVWLATGPWRGPHHPTVTARGTVLLFDNLGNDGDSRLLELEVTSGAIVSAWSPEDPTQFSSQFCGVAAPLANGNVLVTESCRGRAFELTPNGDLVWEYLSPRRAGPLDRFVAALFEVERLAEDLPGVRAALDTAR